MPVGQIKLGMHIVEANGRVGVVSEWRMVPGVKVMYNLEVAHDHTFVVGVGMWIVHNCGSASDASKQAIDLVQNDTNKMNHIFGKPEHNWPLTGLDQGGNLELIRSTVEENHSIITSAPFPGEYAKSFGKFAVTVRAVAVKGVIRIGTAWVN